MNITFRCAGADQRSTLQLTTPQRTLVAAFSLLSVVQPLMAQTAIPAGANLNGFAPINSTVWNLGGDAYLSDGASISFMKNLPSGSPGLTINGVGGGSLVTLNDGAAHYEYFGSSTSATLNLSNVTLTGGRSIAPFGGGGGALNVTSGDLTINTAGAVTFLRNTAISGGGAIKVNAGSLIVNGALSASENTTTGASSGGGGAINVGGTGNLTVTGAVAMNGNISSNGGGGAIAVSAGAVSLAATSGDVGLTNNISNGNGGAILSSGAGGSGGSVLLGNTSGTVTVTGNKAGYDSAGVLLGSPQIGGAILSGGSTTLNGAVELSDNAASGSGGGIYAAGGVNVNGSLTASRNFAGFGGNGGAISAGSGDVVVSNGVSLLANSAILGNFSEGGRGAGINATFGSVSVATIAGNVSLIDNVGGSDGGAINASNTYNDTSVGGYVTIGNPTGTLTVTGNKAGFDVAGNVANAAARGGAVTSSLATSLTGTAHISTNTASMHGGAVYAGTEFTLDARGASTIAGNRAGGQGGAFWSGGSASLIATGGDISLSGNTAGNLGGAVYLGTKAVTLSAVGGSIRFSGNTQNTGSTPQANAVYIANTNGDSTMALNSEIGRGIYFFDPIQNNPAKGSIAVNKTGPGIVSFDGTSYATALDRWSQIYGNTQVQGGSFEVANDAIYGVLAADVGQSVPSTFATAPGTTLQGGGVGTLRADVVTLNGSLSIAGLQGGTRGVFNVYSSDVTFGGGKILFNTFLNDGVAQNTDLLALNLGGSAVSGRAFVAVTNVGGPGAVTTGDGIKLVQTNNGTSTGAFVLGTRAVAGPYEYLLYQGGNARTGGNAADGNWYLRSEVVVPPPLPPPGPPAPPAPPGPPVPPAPTPSVLPPIVVPLYRPEVGAYLSNQRQASGMFVHSLHDRLGEPQWIEGQSFDTPNERRRSGWLRIVNKQTKAADSADGNFNVDTDTTLIQGGGDLARWAVGGDTGRLHLGGMLGYGSSSGDAHAQFNPAQAQGKVEGWSVGPYVTWYQNDANKLGWYVDGWGTYGWFDNKAQGDTLPEVKYDAKALTVSGETGYAMKLGSTDWVVEPQGQLIYVKYDEDDITEPNGTRINGKDGSGWISRIGVRTYRTWVREDGRRLQPYLTLNWWHDSVDNELNFNTVALKNIYPSNRYEVKLGLNADLARGWTAWGNLGYQWGEQSYRSTLVRVGAKLTW